MANRDYKNVKRFIDGISKEVANTMAGGGGVIEVETVPSVEEAQMFTIYKTKETDPDTGQKGDVYWIKGYGRDSTLTMLDFYWEFEPLPVIKFGNGNSIKVNFSVGSYNIGTYGSGHATEIYQNSTGSPAPVMVITKNEANTQLVARLQIIEELNYVDVSNSIVIYEGDVSSIATTDSIAGQLPTIQFGPAPDYSGYVEGNIYPELDITN